jgi:hypothetical protein
VYKTMMEGSLLAMEDSAEAQVSSNGDDGHSQDIPPAAGMLCYVTAVDVWRLGSRPK